MKNLILILLTLTVLGCATAPAPVPEPIVAPEPIVNKYGDTAAQAEVRAWITTEVNRVNEKRLVVNDMLEAGQIGYEEYFLLMDQCTEEFRTIPERARALFLK